MHSRRPSKCPTNPKDKHRRRSVLAVSSLAHASLRNDLHTNGCCRGSVLPPQNSAIALPAEIEIVDPCFSRPLRVAGYHLGVLNTCLHWVAEDLGFDETRGGSLVVSAALVGAAVGALLAGQFADRVGPKKALLLNNSSLIVGCILIAWAPGGIWAAILGMQPLLVILCSLSRLPHPTFLF